MIMSDNSTLYIDDFKPSLIQKAGDHPDDKSRVLLQGLEILAQYHSLRLDWQDLTIELKHLAEEALQQGELSGYSFREDSAIRQMVEELRIVNMVVDKHDAKPEALIQILLEINFRNRWLSKTALAWVSSRLEIPLPRIYQIATFYKAFNLAPAGRHLVQVCLGTACQVKNAPGLIDMITRILHIQPGETDKDGRFTLTTVNCLGCCSLGPVMVIDGNYYSQLSHSQLAQIMEKYK